MIKKDQNLKAKATVIAAAITKLVNLSLAQAKVPKALISFTVRPIHKSGRK